MVQEDKVILMTRCAIYEQNCGNKELPTTEYFKRDYVMYNIWKTLIGVVVAYVLALGTYVAIYYEKVLGELNLLHFKELGIKAGIVLFAVLVVYFLIAYIVYARRFNNIKKHVNLYYRNLKKLQVLYREERHGKKKTGSFQESVVGGESAQNDEFIDY